jgi:DNA-directed RNA polymerase subunit N (RpoN/RPB10)
MKWNYNFMSWWNRYNNRINEVNAPNPASSKLKIKNKTCWTDVMYHVITSPQILLAINYNKP